MCVCVCVGVGGGRRRGRVMAGWRLHGPVGACTGTCRWVQYADLGPCCLQVRLAFCNPVAPSIQQAFQLVPRRRTVATRAAKQGR